MDTGSKPTHCPTCKRSLELGLSAEEVTEKLQNLEPIAVLVLEGQLSSMNETVAQRAAKLLLEWTRGKPQTTVHQTVEAVTAIRYESAAWLPDPDEPGFRQSADPPLELPSGG